MSMQHINSDVETLPCLDMFDTKPTGSQILSCHKTSTTSEPLSAASTQMPFSIAPVVKEFIKLSSAAIELTYKVADDDDADLAGQDAFTGSPAGLKV